MAQFTQQVAQLVLAGGVDRHRQIVFRDGRGHLNCFMQRLGDGAGDDQRHAHAHEQAGTQQTQQQHLAIGDVLVGLLGVADHLLFDVVAQSLYRGQVSLGRRHQLLTQHRLSPSVVAGLLQVGDFLVKICIGIALFGADGEQFLATLADDASTQRLLHFSNLVGGLLDQRFDVIDQRHLTWRFGQSQRAVHVESSSGDPGIGEMRILGNFCAGLHRVADGFQAHEADGRHRDHQQQHCSESQCQAAANLEIIDRHTCLLCRLSAQANWV